MPRLSIHHGSAGGGWNEHIDYCRRCYPRGQRAAETQWGATVDMDNEHPSYTLDEYSCESCGRTLTEDDA